MKKIANIYDGDTQDIISQNSSISLNTSHIITKQTIYKLYVGDIEDDPVVLSDIFHALQESTENDILEIRISSDGGLVSTGIAMMNVINDCFPDRVVTIIDEMAASMAAYIFICGNKRYIYDHSAIMIHSIHFGISGNVSAISNLVDFQKKQNSFLLKKYFGNYLSEDNFNFILKGGDLFFNAYDMCVSGLATDVILSNGDTISAEDYLKSLKGDTKKDQVEKKPIKKQRKSIIKEVKYEDPSGEI